MNNTPKRNNNNRRAQSPNATLVKKDGKIIRSQEQNAQRAPAEIKEKIVRYKGPVDRVFLALVLILICFGSVMVFSASYAYSMSQDPGNGYLYIQRQIGFVLFGLLCMLGVSRLEPEVIKKFTPVAYWVTIGLLVLVFLIGTVGGGAKRWIMVGPISVQPSEIAKATLVMMLALHFEKHGDTVLNTKDNREHMMYGLFRPLFYICLVCVLVALEKHLSGTIIIFCIGIMLVWMGGLKPTILLVPGLVGGTVLSLIAWFVPYTRRRLEIWFDPTKDITGSGWQTIQGLRAIGSGGLLGLGPTNSRQKHMYVSQPQNDFIYSILCEELGFVGAIAVIVLFILLIVRGYKIAMKTTDVYSSLVVMGIVSKVGLQAAFNIGVVTNTLPNTGISLPFFSYGGSSTVVLLVEMGIVLSISRFSRQDR